MIEKSYLGPKLRGCRSTQSFIDTSTYTPLLPFTTHLPWRRPALLIPLLSPAGHSHTSGAQLLRYISKARQIRRQ